MASRENPPHDDGGVGCTEFIADGDRTGAEKRNQRLTLRRRLDTTVRIAGLHRGRPEVVLERRDLQAVGEQ